MRRSGFTLIELIISVTIFAIISITVYSTFYMGIMTWRKGQDKEYLQRIRLTLLKIDEELKDTFFFSKMPFKGTHQEMLFPLVISDETAERTYIVTYSGDEDERTGLWEFIRKEKVFSEEVEGEGEEKIRKLLSSLKSIKFEYTYESGSLTESFEWQESWKGEEQNKLPSGVRVSLEMDDSDEIYSKVIFLQHGELGEAK